jgi:CheY-like chemotaxis protein
VPRGAAPGRDEPRSPSPPNRICEGTDLGLSVCHGIVSSLGGEIDVESEVGRGTVGRVLLPRSRGALEALVTTPAPQAPLARRPRVLVVDDEPLVAAAVRRQLAREHDVEVVTTGADALERVRRGDRFDVVLCDLAMPCMTGVELAERLEGIAPAQAEALLFMTGGALTEATRRFAEAHAGRLLEKPIASEALRRHIHELLST